MGLPVFEATGVIATIDRARPFIRGPQPDRRHPGPVICWAPGRGLRPTGRFSARVAS
jgi:hypothetical protein